MPKFYIHNKFAAEVTEVLEIEAKSADEVLEAYQSGVDYRCLGLSVGDTLDWAGGNSTEVFDAKEHNLPLVFYPSESAT